MVRELCCVSRLAILMEASECQAQNSHTLEIDVVSEKDVRFVSAMSVSKIRGEGCAWAELDSLDLTRCEGCFALIAPSLSPYWQTRTQTLKNQPFLFCIRDWGLNQRYQHMTVFSYLLALSFLAHGKHHRAPMAMKIICELHGALLALLSETGWIDYNRPDLQAGVTSAAGLWRLLRIHVASWYI